MKRAIGATAVVVALIGVMAAWTPLPPWFGAGGRATQTAVARATRLAGTPTATLRPLTPTRTPTATRTPTVTRTITPTVTPTGTPVPTPVGAVETPPATPIPNSGTPTATFWTGQQYPQYSGPTLTPPAFIPNTGATFPLDAEELEYVRLLNEYRASLGLAPLVVNGPLTAAAQWMADDTARYGYLSHTDRTGRDSGARMNDFGSSPYTWRCEIAQGGYGDGAQAFVVWRLSNGHNPCQIDPKYTIVGVGRAWGPLDGWRFYATMGSDPGSSWPTPTPGAMP